MNYYLISKHVNNMNFNNGDIVIDISDLDLFDFAKDNLEFVLDQYKFSMESDTLVFESIKSISDSFDTAIAFLVFCILRGFNIIISELSSDHYISFEMLENYSLNRMYSTMDSVSKNSHRKHPAALTDYVYKLHDPNNFDIDHKETSEYYQVKSLSKISKIPSNLIYYYCRKNYGESVQFGSLYYDHCTEGLNYLRGRKIIPDNVKNTILFLRCNLPLKTAEKWASIL